MIDKQTIPLDVTVPLSYTTSARVPEPSHQQETRTLPPSQTNTLRSSEGDRTGLHELSDTLENPPPPPKEPPITVCTFETDAQLTDAQLGSLFRDQLFARCARGDHDIRKKHGVLGIILGVFLFPIGLVCFIRDVEKRCSRCGTVVKQSYY